MNNQNINRKQFLRGNFKRELALRPPWSLPEEQFTDRCTRCGDCISSCPYNLIVKGSAGFPEMNFQQQGCDYCEACVEACQTQALQIKHQASAFPSGQTAVISEQCFAQRGIVCRSCGEACEYEAIEFKLAVGGVSHLQLNTLLCDGCGECVHTCPANAIQIQIFHHGDSQ